MTRSRSSFAEASSSTGVWTCVTGYVTLASEAFRKDIAELYSSEQEVVAEPRTIEEREV